MDKFTRTKNKILKHFMRTEVFKEGDKLAYKDRPGTCDMLRGIIKNPHVSKAEVEDFGMDALLYFKKDVDEKLGNKGVAKGQSRLHDGEELDLNRVALYNLIGRTRTYIHRAMNKKTGLTARGTKPKVPKAYVQNLYDKHGNNMTAELAGCHEPTPYEYAAMKDLGIE